MLHGVAFVLRAIAQFGQGGRCPLAQLFWHHRVHAAMADHHGQGGVGLAGGHRHGHIGGQGEQAGQGLGVAQGGLVGNGSTLRETRNNDAFAGNAAGDFPLDECIYRVR